MRRSATALAIAAASLGAAAPTGAAERLRPADARGPLRNERLSDEERLTRVARTFVEAPIRRAPRPGARPIGRLRFRTEDGPLEVYLLLRSRVDARKRTWIELRVPGRPNGRTGWVLEQHLSEPEIIRTQLRLDRKRLRATLLRSGRRIWQAPIGIGKASTPTPAGRFWIRERLRSLGGAYGPWAFGTSAYSKLSDWPRGGVVGIHGTDQPGLIPGRPSHGCVRVRNDKILQLARLMPIGTPVLID